MSWLMIAGIIYMSLLIGVCIGIGMMSHLIRVAGLAKSGITMTEKKDE